MLEGRISLDRIDEAQLLAILDAKRKSPTFQFFPEQLRPVVPYRPLGGAPTPPVVYSNAILSWRDRAGLSTVHDLLATLIDQDKAASRKN